MLILKQIKMNIKNLFSKSKSQHTISNPISFTTTIPDQQLKFEEWKRRFGVSSKYSLLEDSEYLQKIRKNDISSIGNQKYIN